MEVQESSRRDGLIIELVSPTLGVAIPAFFPAWLAPAAEAFCKKGQTVLPMQKRLLKFYRSLSTKLFAYRQGRLEELLKPYYGKP